MSSTITTCISLRNGGKIQLLGSSPLGPGSLFPKPFHFWCPGACGSTWGQPWVAMKSHCR